MSKLKKAEPVVVKGYPDLVDTRLDQIKFRFKEIRADGLVITYLPNIRYLTNFSGSSAAIIIFDEKIYFFTDRKKTIYLTKGLPRSHCTIETTKPAQLISRISMKLCLYVAPSEL